MQLKEHSLGASIALELQEASGKIQTYSKLCGYRIREIEVETQGTGHDSSYQSFRIKDLLS